MSYLHYLCSLAHSGVQHIFCCVFVVCIVYPLLSASLDCLFLIAPSFFSNVYLRLVYPMLPVFLDCPFLIALRFSLTFIYL
jgi:hypothetical protein